MKKILYVAAALVITGIVAGYAYTSFGSIHSLKINSHSMAPTLRPGDSVEIDRRAFVDRDPAKEDIIAFATPIDADKWIVSRIKGVPGDTITVDEASGEKITLKANEYFIVGDNLEGSAADSRRLGPISRDQIKGKVRVP